MASAAKVETGTSEMDKALSTWTACVASLATARSEAEAALERAVAHRATGTDVGDGAWQDGVAAMRQAVEKTALAARIDRSTPKGVMTAVNVANQAFGWYRLARIDLTTAATEYAAVRAMAA